LAGIETFVTWTEQQNQPRRTPVQAPPSSNEAGARPRLFVVSELLEAAELLGVQLDANPDEIRRALRFKMTATGAHPDHGGDAVEAQRLIAARDLLIDYTTVRAFEARAGGAP
jgi:hypothetical protein